MRPIDADVLVGQLSDKAKEMLGIAEQCQGRAINYYTGAKYGFAKAAIIANGLPTIEPKRGRWKDVEEVLYEGNTEGTPYTVTAVGYKCSECGTEMGNLWSFCPNCGAKMDDDWEEPEINPCRGCDDYDGRGGCKSHGGCGAERSEDEKAQ